MRLYEIDWERLAGLLLPIRLRQPRTLALLRVMLRPVQVAHSAFMRWKAATEYRLNHSGQVAYLEKVLNDTWGLDYDPADHAATQSIIILDGEQLERAYLHQAAEDLPLYLDDPAAPVYLFRESEYLAEYSDFIVLVPQGIVFDEARMRAVIDFYKLAGKRYKIQIV